jgi:hypothetical protein
MKKSLAVVVCAVALAFVMFAPSKASASILEEGATTAATATTGILATPMATAHVTATVTHATATHERAAMCVAVCVAACAAVGDAAPVRLMPKAARRQFYPAHWLIAHDAVAAIDARMPSDKPKRDAALSVGICTGQLDRRPSVSKCCAMRGKRDECLVAAAQVDHTASRRPASVLRP